MPLIVAAFLLGAVASRPPDDDHGVRRARPPVSATNSDSDESATTAPPRDQSGDAGDDDKPTAGSLIPGAPEADDDEEGRSQPDSTIVVTARRLDAARTQVDAGLGASVYSLTNEAIENRPGGETGSLSDILTQAPGVTLSGGILNVRGSPANQVRINNVIVPEAVADPADLISSRLSQTTRLITGALPAQFGFAPAGVISITTKNGLYQHGGQVEIFGATDGMIEPAVEWAGSAGPTSLFASGELEHDRSTLVDAAGNAARGRRKDIDGLAFADHVIDQDNRVSFILGGAHERREIGPTSVGPGIETNDSGYGVATYQHSHGSFTLQTSLFAGLGSNEARFNDRTRERRSSWGMQADGADAIGRSHTIRFGLLATRSSVRELEPGANGSSAARTSLGAYAQDEWRLAPSLTINPGVRVEWLDGLGSSAELEPRVSLVWQTTNGFAAHIGYARYASAAPLGEGTSSTRLTDERDDYVDGGVQQKLGALTVGIDAYWRSVHDAIAEHQAIGSAVPSAFAFKRARIRGVELSATYARRGTTAWANLSLSSARGRTVIGGEEIFAPESLAAALAKDVSLASDRPVTASAGFTQRLGKLSLGAQLFLSSGAVRTLTLTDPNGAHGSPYALLGLAAVYHARIADRPADLRVDVTNLTNVHYATSDATSLEGGWTNRGRGRALTIGIEQGF